MSQPTKPIEADIEHMAAGKHFYVYCKLNFKDALRVCIFLFFQSGLQGKRDCTLFKKRCSVPTRRYPFWFLEPQVLASKFSGVQVFAFHC